ncbi:hypothetical protein [Aeromonas enterica]
MDKHQKAAFEHALHQINQLKASQPTGLSISINSDGPRVHCKSIEHERPENIYRTQCPYVGVEITVI